MGLPMWFDGFIEEHYGNGPRVAIRFAMAAYLVFCLFSGASNIAIVFAKSAPFFALVQGVAILFFAAQTLAMVWHYRKQAESPQFKTFVVILMLVNFLFCVGACMVFHASLNNGFAAGAPPAEPPATTVPSNSSTPSPTNFSHTQQEEFLVMPSDSTASTVEP